MSLDKNRCDSAEMGCIGRLPSRMNRRRNMYELTRSSAVCRAIIKGIKQEKRPLFELLGLSSGFICRVVFVAIDFERIPNLLCSDSSDNLDCEVGLALLDTADLERDEPCSPIQTYNFASGSQSYQQQSTKKFLFGQSVSVKRSEMLSRIESLIPRERQIVLVGHGISSDLRALIDLGLDFSAYYITTLDTHHVATELFSMRKLTLCHLLRRLGCSYSHLHCGGNDANFTLRALLLLAIRSYNQPGEASERKLAMIRTMALEPIAIHVHAEERRAMRAERKKAHQAHQSLAARSCKPEVKRAERAARKQCRQAIVGYEDVGQEKTQDTAKGDGSALLSNLFDEAVYEEGEEDKEEEGGMSLLSTLFKDIL